MEQITFSTDLESNIRLMQAIFQGDNTFVTRRAAGHKGLCCAVFFFDGMVNNIAINPVSYTHLGGLFVLRQPDRPCDRAGA